MLKNYKLNWKIIIKKNNLNLDKLNIIKYLILSYLTTLKNTQIKILKESGLYFSIPRITITNSKIHINVFYYLFNSNKNYQDYIYKKIKIIKKVFKNKNNKKNKTNKKLNSYINKNLKNNKNNFIMSNNNNNSKNFKNTNNSKFKNTNNWNINFKNYNLPKVPSLDIFKKNYSTKNKNVKKINSKKIMNVKLNNSNILNKIFNNKKINNIINLIQTLTNKKIEFNFTRIYYPYIDANIFSKWLLLQLQFKNFKKIIFIIIRNIKLVNFAALIKDYQLENNKNKFINLDEKSENLKNSKNKKLILKTPTIYVGYRIFLSGRLINERSKPRKTKKSFKQGIIKDYKNIIFNIGSSENVNELGSHSVKVILASRRI